MQEVKVTVNGGIISGEELQAYITSGRRNQPHNDLIGKTVTLTLDGEYADVNYQYANPIVPQRFSIGGDMIIENFETLKKAKQMEYLDKVFNEI